MKNAALWDIKAQFVPHRRHITSPLESPVSCEERTGALCPKDDVLHSHRRENLKSYMKLSCPIEIYVLYRVAYGFRNGHIGLGESYCSCLQSLSCVHQRDKN
jgi:hypothetical protein